MKGFDGNPGAKGEMVIVHHMLPQFLPVTHLMQGVMGDDGMDGDPGFNGEPGETGLPVSLTKCTLIHCADIICFHSQGFNGPDGDKGTKGIPGPTGPRGEPVSS